MPVAASGSIAFLGAARFQGFWNATSNVATGSGISGAPSGPISGLFATGTSADGGYAAATGLTSSAGSYWQVTGSGTHNVEGHTNWNLNDWCIYSGSASGPTKKWTRLAYEDTIASIVIGNVTKSALWHLTGSADKQVLFISGASDLTVVQSGSDNFIYDYANQLLAVSQAGIGTVIPQHTLSVTGTLGVSGATTVAGPLTASSNVVVTGTLDIKGPITVEDTTSTDTVVVIDSTSDDGHIDLYANNVLDTHLRAAGASYFNKTQASGGGLGIGTAGSAVYELEVSGTTCYVNLESTGDTRLIFTKNKVPSINNTYGLISWGAFDATGTPILRQAASIEALADADCGASDMPGRLVFSTTADGAASATSRMTIKNDGNVGIGTTSPGTKLEIAPDGTANPNSTGTTSVTGHAFRIKGGSGGSGWSNSVLDIGVGDGKLWLQGRDKSNYATDLDILLNPNGGNVGIGTTTPQYTLSVTGTMGVSSAISASSGIHIPAYQFITFGTGSANRMDVGMQGITISGSGVRVESSGSIELELKKHDGQISMVSGSTSLSFSFDVATDTTSIRPGGAASSAVIFQNYNGFEAARIHDHSQGIGGFGYRRNLKSVTSALNLSNIVTNIEYSDNILLVTMPRTGGAYTITLPTTLGGLLAPAIMNGFHLRIIVSDYADGANGGTDSASVTITVGDIVGTPGTNADIIMGHIIAADMGTAPTGITKTNQVITFDGTNGSPVVLPGDYVDLTCIYSTTTFTAWHLIGMATT